MPAGLSPERQGLFSSPRPPGALQQLIRRSGVGPAAAGLLQLSITAGLLTGMLWPAHSPLDLREVPLLLLLAACSVSEVTYPSSNQRLHHLTLSPHGTLKVVLLNLGLLGLSALLQVTRGHPAGWVGLMISAALLPLLWQLNRLLTRHPLP